MADNKKSNDQNGAINLAYVNHNSDELSRNSNVRDEEIKTEINGIGENNQRAQWGNSLEFLMSCIAMSVGLGNIWRFPFTAFDNGGGAFLIPYLFTLFVIARPMYYMEMILGQFSSKSNVHMFTSMAPGFVGIGYGQLFSVIAIATYYCSLMSMTLYYFFHSFITQLPWSVCDPEWTNCINSSGTTNVTNKNSSSSSELYFTQTVLHENIQLDNGIGAPDLQLTLYLMTSWICVFIVSCRGVKSSGKFSYFLALFPYVILLALLIRAVTLDGAVDGILYFIEPKWEELLNPRVWYAAVAQCFFSLNIGFGSIVMYASYNNFQHNIYRDALIVSVTDTFTSFLAGFTIFGILGHLAHILGVEIRDVVKTGGSGLAFISYPDAISKFDWFPQLFAVLFFFMLFVLGVGSLVALQSSAATVIKDQFPVLKDWWVAAGTCIVGFLIGLFYIVPEGQLILSLVDHFAGTFNVYVMAIAEIIAVMWLYGVEDICLDIEYMLQRRVNVYWRICWSIMTPLILIIILIYSLATQKPLKYGSYSYPYIALTAGWLLLFFGILQIPIWAVYSIYNNRHLRYPEMIRKSFSSKNWGPKDPNQYKDWQNFKNEKKEQRKDLKANRIIYTLHTLLGKY